MNILVDGRPFVKTAAGISTFLRCSIFEWANQQPEYNFFVFLPKKIDSSLELGELPPNILLLDFHNRLTKHLPNLLLLLLYIPFLIYKYKIDLYYAPVPCIPFFIPKKTKTLVVVHDVVNLEQSDTMELKNKIANKLFFLRSIRNADFIWTNSYYTKERVEHYIPKRKCKSIYTGCSVDRNVYKKIEISDERRLNIKSKYGITGKFILFVGSLEPRKNLSFFLGLMPRLFLIYGIQLVVVGGRGWKNSSIKEIISQSNFPRNSTVFCGYVSNRDLVELYNIADCFVSASLCEGFGMPQLEAMLCGCPVVTAHNTAMIEVAQNKTGVKSVKGYNPKEWIDSILDVINKNEIPKLAEFSEYYWPTIIHKLHEYMD